jgi:4-amino-4-deoxy-L-arabinose transferase-like glycosyltransferase
MAESPEPNKKTVNIRGIVAFLGILLILIGQYFTFAMPVSEDQLPPWMIFLSLAGIAVIMLSFFIRVKPAFQAKIDRISIPQKVVWIASAILLSALTVFSMLLFIKNGKTIYIPVILTWFGSGVVYIYAFRDQFPSLTTIKTWVKAHRTELLILGGIILLAAFLRLYKLGVYPRVIDGDEGMLGEFAKSTNAGELANPFALWENIGALYMQTIALCIRIFGANAFALRILPAISGILAIPALYIFARQITNKRIAMISSFLLAVSNAQINFSRISSVGYIHDTWLVPLELFLLLAGLEKRKSWMAAAGGVLLAIHYSIYLTSQLITGLILVFMLIALIFMRGWFLPKIRQAAAFWGGFAIMIQPEIFYAVRNPNEFFDRIIQNGSLQTGWAAQTATNTGQSIIQVLAGRVLHVFLSLIYYPAQAYYGSSIPLLTLFGAVLFLAGLGIILLRVRTPGMLLLNGYFWAPTVAIGVLSIPPSADSYRILAALPAALLIAAIALEALLESVGAGWDRARRVYGFITGGVLLSITVFGIWAYFGDFIGQCRYVDSTSRFASYLGTSARSFDQGSSIYLLSDSVFFNGSHASTTFLSEGRTINNMPDPIDNWQASTGDTVIANPNRIPELEQWIQTHPGGQTKFVYDCNNLILLSYHLP